MKITFEEIKDYLNFRLEKISDSKIEVGADGVLAYYYIGFGPQFKPGKLYLIFKTNFEVEWLLFFGHLDETFYVNKLIKQFNSEKRPLEAGIIDAKQLAFGAKKIVDNLDDADKFFTICDHETRHLYENSTAKQLIDLTARTNY